MIRTHTHTGPSASPASVAGTGDVFARSVGSLDVALVSVCVSAPAAWPSRHLSSQRGRRQPGLCHDPLGVGKLGMFSFLAPRGQWTVSPLPKPGPTQQVPSRSQVKAKAKAVSRRREGPSLARGAEGTEVLLIWVTRRSCVCERDTRFSSLKNKYYCARNRGTGGRSEF